MSGLGTSLPLVYHVTLIVCVVHSHLKLLAIAASPSPSPLFSFVGVGRGGGERGEGRGEGGRRERFFNTLQYGTQFAIQQTYSAFGLDFLRNNVRTRDSR